MPYMFELEGYCENCQFFEAEVESIEFSSLGDEFPRMQHTVRCRNKERCSRAVRIANQVMPND